MKKIKDSFGGILGGLVFILIGVVLLWWNEGNNVRNLKTTAELSKTYIEVSSEKVDASNEGKLVATSGKVKNEQELVDSLFGVNVKTPLLKRIVEVYQWEEESETDSDNNTTYNYKKVWSSDLIDSSNFHNTNGHTNPTYKEYQDEEYTSSLVNVGAFELSQEQIRSLSTNGTYNGFNEETVAAMNYTISGNYITNTKDMNNPQIGEFRIHYEYNNSTDLSVLAVQRGNSFIDFVSKAGKTVNRVMDGVKSGEEMINIIKTENKILKWVLRLVGVLLVISGVSALFKPLSTLANFVPILGGLVDTAIGLVAFLVGGALSLIVIAVAWIRYRPLLGIGLLAIAGVLIFFLIKKAKTKKETPVVNDMVNPVPPVTPEQPQTYVNPVPPVTPDQPQTYVNPQDQNTNQDNNNTQM